MSPIYLVGFMGVGKSTVGKNLAYRLNCDFVDLDDLFEQTYRINIHNFFEKYGEQLFREIESKLLSSTFSLKNVVVSTGGGTCCYGDAMQQMNNNGLTIFLEMEPAMIVHRLLNAKRKRPLVTGRPEDELEAFVKQRLEERMPYYRQAQLTVNASALDLDNLMIQIRNAL